ncbi:MAG: DUF4339 domain-containing protein [Planctomycetota bacterium]
MASVEWFYAKGDTQYGPVSAAELKQRADRGEFGPDDLVWREGMEEWITARKIKGLFDGDLPPAAGSAEAPPEPAPTEEAPPFEQSTFVGPRLRRGSGRHVFDLFLAFARRQFSGQFVDSASRIFTFAGHYGLYLAAGLLFVFSLLYGIKTEQSSPVFLGTAGLVILLVLQYTAGRYFGALERLNRSTPSRMCSPAFLDCLALLHMAGGLVLLVWLAILAAVTGPLLLVLPAVAVFILLQYAAVLALNPKSLNIDIAPETSAGEEAIGIFSLFVKLTTRMVPVVFGVGVVAGLLTLLCALGLAIVPQKTSGDVVVPEEFSVSEMPETTAETSLEMAAASAMATTAAAVLTGAAALPFVTYVVLLGCFLFIDVTRAVLSIPGKLDVLAGEIEDEEEGEPPDGGSA